MSGNLAYHMSENEDHITKDNNDPMPFVRSDLKITITR